MNQSLNNNTTATLPQGKIQGVLRRNDINPRYFTDDSGQAVYLTGSHTWNNLIDMGHPPVEFDCPRYMDWLVAQGHNFVRMWAWDMLTTWNPKDVVVHFPWKRTGPGLAVDGKPRFDLSCYDEEYFSRLAERIALAQDKGIYISIMFFDGWGSLRPTKPSSIPMCLQVATTSTISM
ncbi:MAG: DUF4038 domain-containing protein [Phycisphaerales bacterium]|nr:DUF4038 domain-containing protein [Phycisphaerales bacterium]